MNIQRDLISVLDDIIGSPYSIGGDYALDAYLRAIAIKNGETDPKKIRPSIYSDSLYGNAGNIVDYAGYTYCIYSIRDEAYFASLKTPDGWTGFDEAPYPINKYMSQYKETKIFANPESKRVIACVKNGLNSRWVQSLISVFPRIAPWLFPEGISDDLKKFCQTLAIDNTKVTAEEVQNTFVNYVNSFAEKIDFRNMKLHKYLDGIASRTKEIKVRGLESSINSTTSNINSYRRSLCEQIKKLEALRTELAAFRLLPSDDGKEVFDFFSNHKNIDVFYADGSTLEYCVTDTLEYYDEEEFEKIYNNKSSYLFDYITPESSTAKIIYALLAEHKGQLVFTSCWKLESLKYVSNLKDYIHNYNAQSNPHIYYYGCDGGNSNYYEAYAETGDWDLAIEQSISANKNLNFGDGAVIPKFARWLKENSLTKCIKVENETGLLSPDEFYDKYVKEI